VIKKEEKMPISFILYYITKCDRLANEEKKGPGKKKDEVDGKKEGGEGKKMRILDYDLGLI